MIKRGYFISFEGGEAVGKTTQITRLSDFLQKQGIKVITTREPGGTPGAEQVRRLLKEGPRDLWQGMSEALLLYAARYDLTERIIKPALAAGTWVLSDRFCDSTFVYQGVGKKVGIQKIEDLHHLVLGNFMPDITFYFDLPPEVSLARAKARAARTPGEALDRFEGLAQDFYQSVYDAYRALAKKSERFRTLDASQSISKVEQAIQSVIKAELHG